MIEYLAMLPQVWKFNCWCECDLERIQPVRLREGAIAVIIGSQGS